MLPADVSRCHGGNGVRGRPLQPCVMCERRIIPHGQRVVMMAPPVHREAGEWVCDMRIPYSQEAAA